MTEAQVSSWLKRVKAALKILPQERRINLPFDIGWVYLKLSTSHPVECDEWFAWDLPLLPVPLYFSVRVGFLRWRFCTFITIE